MSHLSRREFSQAAPVQRLRRDLERQWEAFVSGTVDPASQPHHLILESWLRSKESRVDPYLKRSPIVLSEEEMVKLREQSDLFGGARPIMDEMAPIMVEAGQVLALADRNGTLLKVYANRDIWDNLTEIRFIAGANWSEEVTGTTGSGTALKTRQPVRIFGPEHFCRSWHSWVCSAAPIFDPRTKELLGVLEASACGALAQSYPLVAVMAMVAAIERQIEKLRWLREQPIIDRYYEISCRNTSDGILAIDSQSQVIKLNSGAARLLGVDPEMCSSMSLKKFLDPTSASSVLGLSAATDEKKEFRMSLNNSGTDYSMTCHPVVIGTRKIGSILEIDRHRSGPRKVQPSVHGIAKYTFEDLIGNSPSLLDAIRVARIATQNNFPVLILGESGTGKEMIAATIHHASSRRAGPFIAVNCAAIPSELTASELFGYVEGAFTGAKRSGNPGKFELANGGTIFLDEISELSLNAQAALLRVLQEMEITRVGSSEVILLDVRIIAATNSDLYKRADEKMFRSDLLHRINVFSLTMPPLRERREDICTLANFFLRSTCPNRLDRDEPNFAKDVMDCFFVYGWPGNVRELKNVVQRAATLAESAQITLRELPVNLMADHSISSKQKVNSPSLQDGEKTLILRSLQECCGNISLAAIHLGVGRTTLYRKLKRYGIERVWKSG